MRWQQFGSGESNRTSKLTVAEVKQIKRDLRDGVLQRVIAEKFGVSGPTIARINTGRAWRKVKIDDENEAGK